MATNMSPIPYEFHWLCVLLFVSLLGWMLFFLSTCQPVFTHGSSRVVIQSRHSTSFSLNEPELVFQTKLDLSLCTVGTLSAFLQTADNICLLTCTVTCRTLLPHPARPPPVCPIPPSSSRLRSTNPVPSPQAASSQCKLKLHFILSRLD